MKITKEFRQLLDAIKEGKSIPAPNRNEANHGTGTYVETDTDIDTESSAENEIDIMDLVNAATDPLTARRRSDDTNFSEISTNSGESRNTRNSQTRRQNRGFGM